MNSAFVLPLVVSLGFAISFLLSGMEAGVAALSRLRIRRLAREGDVRAQRLQGFLDHPEKFLWTILVGNSLATCAVISVVALQVKEWLILRPTAFMALMVGVLLLLWIFGDLLPKLLFRRFPNPLCLHGVGSFRLLHFLLSPAVAATAWISDGLLRLTGGKAMTRRLFGSRAELRQAIEESAQALSREEVVMIHRILDLQSRRVRDVMTPIDEAATLPSNGTVADLLALVRERPVSYVPVWRGSGRNRRVLGVVALNTILMDETIVHGRVLETLVQPALFLDEDSRLEATLHSLQRGRARIGIVLNAARREAGVITLNDILRTMFGEVGV